MTIRSKIGSTVLLLGALGLGGGFLYGTLGSEKEYNTDEIIQKEPLTGTQTSSERTEARKERSSFVSQESSIPVKKKEKDGEYVTFDEVKIYKVMRRGSTEPTYLIEDTTTKRQYWVRREQGELFINDFRGFARRIFGEAQEAIEPMIEEIKPYAKEAARVGLKQAKKVFDREVDLDSWVK
ncbi:MAG: hypothetical protein KAT43_03935 [Nanoarchaeota archaeon]|nr:hypothetical protein [Nanoarchaeota archaeon]